MSQNNPIWGVPSHSPSTPVQVSRVVGGLVAAAGVTLGLALQGGTNQDRVARAVPDNPNVEILQTSRSYAMRPPAGTQVNDSDAGAGTDTATLTAAIPASDTGTGTDNASASQAAQAPRVYRAGVPQDFPQLLKGSRSLPQAPTANAVNSGDSGVGTDAATLTAAISASDTGTGSDNQSVNTGPGAVIPKVVKATEQPILPNLVKASQTVSALAVGPLPAVIPPAIALQGFTNQNKVHRPVPQPPPYEPKEPYSYSIVYYYSAPPIFNVIVPGATNQGYKFLAPKPAEPTVVEPSKIVKPAAVQTNTPSSADSGTGTDNATLAAQITASDTGTGSDSQSASQAGLRPIKPYKALPAHTPEQVELGSRQIKWLDEKILKNSSDEINFITYTEQLRVFVSDSDTGTSTESGSTGQLNAPPVTVSAPRIPHSPDQVLLQSRIIKVGKYNVSASDTGTGTDNQTLAAAIPASDTAGASESASTGETNSLNSSDTGSGTNNQTLAASIPDTSTGTGSEGQQVGTSAPNADNAAGADIATPAARYTVTESGTGTDSAVAGAWQTINVSDTATGTDNATVVELALSGGVASGRVVMQSQAIGRIQIVETGSSIQIINPVEGNIRRIR